MCSSRPTLTNLDFDGNAAVLHLTKSFADTPGEIFFSSQGPNDIEVSFWATAVADRGAGGYRHPGCRPGWGWEVRVVNIGGAATASIPAPRHNKRATPRLGTD